MRMIRTANWSSKRLEPLQPLALANMLSELRRFRVRYTVAREYPNQLEPAYATLSNAGSISSFRVGIEDVPYLVPETGLDTD